MLLAYKWLTRLLTPLVPFYLKRRVKAGKELEPRLSERYGKTDIPRPSGKLVWLHAASVGESVMLLPLISKLKSERPDCALLLTTGTVTSANLMQMRLPKGCLHQFVPIDTPSAVSRFLAHWSPDVAIWAESEIWPNLVTQTKARGIPMALVNARMGERSLKRWQSKLPKMARTLFGAFDTIVPADALTASGLSQITGKELTAAGNLKYAGAQLPVDIKALAAHRAVLEGRPIWCAASTHEGEDEIILAAHKHILESNKDAVLILIPRHPERGSDIAQQIKAAELNFIQTGYSEDITPRTQVILIAAMGQMGLAYRIAPVSLVCGSLLPSLKGHNPLEPTRLGSAVLSGPHIDSFEDVYTPLHDAGGMQFVEAAPAQIAAKVLELLGSRPILEAQVNAAKVFTDSQNAVLNTVWGQVEPLLNS